MGHDGVMQMASGCRAMTSSFWTRISIELHMSRDGPAAGRSMTHAPVLLIYRTTSSAVMGGVRLAIGANYYKKRGG